MRAPSRLLIVIVFVVVTIGCVRRDGRNSDCRWPGEASHNSVSPRHLSADAEFAEDLAIRYADTHFGPGSPIDTYVAERDQCAEKLFAEIGKQHGVSAGQVSAALGQNRAYIDLAESLTFALLYTLAAIVCSSRIWRRYPPAENGWQPGIIMALFVSLLFAVCGTMLGEQWNGLLEGLRIGNGHMSYRALGLFLAQASR